MDDIAINKKFVSIIPMLETIVKGISYKRNKRIEPMVAINEAYIYIIENKHILVDEDFLQRVVIRYITNQIYWTTSTLNKLEGVNNLTDTSFFDIEEEFSDIDSKVEIENWVNDRKCLLELYKEQETNKINLIVLNLYYNKGVTKGIDLAKVLNVNYPYACMYLREMKASVKKFTESYNNNTKK